MKTIAIPIFKSRVSVRLDCAEDIHLVTIEKDKIKTRDAVRLVSTNPLEKVKVLIQLNPDVLICGGLTEYCSIRLKEINIQIIPWVQGDIEEILSLYLKGELKKKHLNT